MSRFGNLEFGNRSGEQRQEQAALKDEHFYLAEADTAFRRGQFEKALRDYSRVLEHNPNLPAAWTGQVRMLIELGEFREARLWADKALEHFPREPELLAAKSVALARTGDLKGALAFSDAAFEERGDTPYIWLARADVLLAREERRAEFCLSKALALAPTNWFVHWLAARILYFYQNFAAALRHAQKAMELDATQAAAWLQVGLCQKALGLAGPARNSLSQALELDPGCRDASRCLNEVGKIGFLQRLTGAWHLLLRR